MTPNVSVARNVGELKPNIYPPLETRLKVIKTPLLQGLAPIFFATCYGLRFLGVELVLRGLMGSSHEIARQSRFTPQSNQGWAARSPEQFFQASGNSSHLHVLHRFLCTVIKAFSALELSDKSRSCPVAISKPIRCII